MKKHILAVMVLLTSISASAQQTAQKPVYLDNTQPIEARVQDALSRMTLEEKIRIGYAQSKFSTPGVPRLGIPEIYMSDGPHGVRPEINWNDWHHAGWTNDDVTAFPALTCLAATWNPELAMKYGRAVGEEARYRKKNILLGPGVNIYRTPLNGRNFEYMGEDPFLAGVMAVPYVQGLQSNGVACCLKHFALNNQETARGSIDVHVSDRALYEIYLPAFKRVIDEANPWSIMGSYNRIWGQHASHNKRLLVEILKKEWNYPGAVVTDWGACHNTEEAIFNGLDIEMGSYTNGLTSQNNAFGYDDYYLANAYLEKCRKGEVPDSIINDKASRILRLIFLTNDYTNGDFGSLNSQQHIDAAREIAQEGIVLLKNANAAGKKPLLPLNMADCKRILVVGNNATRPLCPGGGSSELDAKDEVSPLRGLQERYADLISQGKLTIDYAMGYEVGVAEYGHYDKIPAAVQDSLRNEALEKARQADLVIYVGGLNKNHGQDCEGGDREDYNLPYGQDKLISELEKIQPRTVVVIVSGNAVAMPWLKQTPAVVQSWYLGSEAGHALTDVLSGDVCPSGKTVFSYGNALSDYPAHQFGERSYPGIGERRHEEQWYDDDIFLGYRYFDLQPKRLMFPFGYGLSYTTFEYGKASASSKTISDGGTLDFTLTLRNTGKVAGKEVVQLYVGDDKASVKRPLKELKAFKKVALQPGETKTVTLTVSVDDLKFYDEARHEWVAEPGTFKAFIGASAQDIKQTVAFTYE